MVIELVAGRLMAPYVGVSLYTWTSIIGVVLAGISIGAYLGGLLADKYPRPSTLGWLLFLSGLGAMAISPLVNLIGGAHINIPLMLRILVLTTAIFFIPSCILGMISPVVVKLTLDNLNDTGNIIGKIYAFSTLGSIIGTFATGFFLISWIGTRNILLTVSIILIISAFIFGGIMKRKTAAAVFFAVTIPLLWAIHGYAFKPKLEADAYFYQESDYYTLTLRKLKSAQTGAYVEALIIDHLTHSYTDLKDPGNLEYSYLKIYDEFLQWRFPEGGRVRTLFVGGGGYTFPRYLETKYPDSDINVIEIDPAVSKVALQYLGIPRNTRIKTFNDDARWFVMNHEKKPFYDFIYLDAYNDLSIPYHLTTKEFIAQLKSLLAPDGIILANLIDDVETGKLLPTYIRTLEAVFGRGRVELIVPMSSGGVGITTCIVAASPQKIDMDDFIEKIGRRKGDKMVSCLMPQDMLQSDLSKSGAFVLTDDYVPVDNLIAPIFEERFGYRRD